MLSLNSAHTVKSRAAIPPKLRKQVIKDKLPVD
jgi:hypothetical protein